MMYDERPEIDAAYALVATLYESEDDPEQAMSIAAKLLDRGENDSWASVWWAYGVLHHELSDEGYERALKLLADVDRSADARAAALMLTAEIESVKAVEAGGLADASRQAKLLTEAVVLAPHWPSLRLRLAYPLRELGRVEESRVEAKTALEQLERSVPSSDPFDSAISGTTLDLDYVAGEVKALGVEV